MKQLAFIFVELALMVFPYVLRRSILNSLPSFELAAGCRSGFALFKDILQNQPESCMNQAVSSIAE